MPFPDAESQVAFLRDVQALLEDGQFTATYKFALLIALADLAVESGIADDRRLRIPVTSIAEKFIEYYWQQSAPFPGHRGAVTLVQNRGIQAAVVNVCTRLRDERFATLAQLRSVPSIWVGTLNRVSDIVRKMPLFKLQTINGTERAFLYPNRVEGDCVVLELGVGWNLREFHGLIAGMARERWASMLRSIPANRAAIGDGQDLEDFLFSSQRVSVGHLLQQLADLQHGECLYCGGTLPRDGAHVDHFIPWSLHRLSAVPNFVAAHDKCNLAKSDWLAAEEHLERWIARNARRARGLELIAADACASTDWGRADSLGPTMNVARWAYDRAFVLGQRAWLRGRQLVALTDRYRLLVPRAPSC
ncbi:MAG: HNH endonuclease [Burkholderiaceae bacterium]|nr:HNH endonuclease [Burkholderiaceae bacterium]